MWVPPQASALLAQPPEQPASNRARAGEARQLSAGAPWTRKIPTTERSKALFEHLRAVVDNPELNPDLSELERQEYER